MDTLISLLFALSIFLGAAAISSILAGPTVRVTVGDDHVDVRVRGIWKFWAMKHRLALPLSSITGAEARDDTHTMPRGACAPGTRLPGLLTAGSYGRKEGRAFYATSRRGTEALVIYADDAPYSRVVVQVRDATHTATEIREAATAPPRPPSAVEKRATDPNRRRKHGQSNPGLGRRHRKGRTTRRR